jgi:hypothetical protein
MFQNKYYYFGIYECICKPLPSCNGMKGSRMNNAGKYLVPC